MKSFFSRNIDTRGRVVRAVLGLALIVAGPIAAQWGIWVCVVLVVCGGFCLFEAFRGWCLARACGIKTKL